MKNQIVRLLATGALATGCSKNNDVNEVTPLVLEQLDESFDAGIQDSDAGIQSPDGGMEEALAPPAPEDFEESAESDIPAAPGSGNRGHGS